MPENLRHGARAKIALAIIAYDHDEYSETINLWVDRQEKLEQKSSRKVPRESLFANESAQRLGSVNRREVGQTAVREWPVPRQAAERLSRPGGSPP
jgi:hypothetical protein